MTDAAHLVFRAPTAVSFRLSEGEAKTARRVKPTQGKLLGELYSEAARRWSTTLSSESCSHQGAPAVAQRKWVQLVSMRIPVQSLALLSESGIQHCPELWCRSQMWFGIPAAVAHTYSCSFNRTPSLGTSICHTCGPKPPKKRKKQRKLFTSYLISDLDYQMPMITGNCAAKAKQNSFLSNSHLLGYQLGLWVTLMELILQILSWHLKEILLWNSQSGGSFGTPKLIFAHAIRESHQKVRILTMSVSILGPWKQEL